MTPPTPDSDPNHKIATEFVEHLFYLDPGMKMDGLEGQVTLTSLRDKIRKLLDEQALKIERARNVLRARA